MKSKSWLRAQIRAATQCKPAHSELFLLWRKNQKLRNAAHAANGLYQGVNRGPRLPIASNLLPPLI